MCRHARLSTDYSQTRIKLKFDPDYPAPNIPASWNVCPTDPMKLMALSFGRVCAPASFGRCSYQTANAGQAIRVVASYVDQRPARMYELFEDLALEAMQKAWPCRKKGDALPNLHRGGSTVTSSSRAKPASTQPIAQQAAYQARAAAAKAIA